MFNMMKILIILFIIKLMYVINVMLELMYSYMLQKALVYPNKNYKKFITS